MPDLEEPNHKHPSYEETFKRIATILDVIAEEQHEQARRGAETDARLDRLAQEHARRDSRIDTRLDRLAEEQARRGAGIDARLDRLAEAQQRTDKALADYIEQGRIRDAETTDKLNGLIELMDRHLREHGQ